VIASWVVRLDTRFAGCSIPISTRAMDTMFDAWLITRRVGVSFMASGPAKCPHGLSLCRIYQNMVDGYAWCSLHTSHGKRVNSLAMIYTAACTRVPPPCLPISSLRYVRRAVATLWIRYNMQATFLSTAFPLDGHTEEFVDPPHIRSARNPRGRAFLTDTTTFQPLLAQGTRL
jgi:uncharacterized protein (DUF2132 family)